MVQCIVFYDANLTISPLDRITAEFTKGFSMITSLINIPVFVNNSNNNHYFTKYSKNNRSVSTNDQLNSKSNHLINNYIKDGNLPNSEKAPSKNLNLNATTLLKYKVN